LLWEAAALADAVGCVAHVDDSLGVSGMLKNLALQQLLAARVTT